MGNKINFKLSIIISLLLVSTAFVYLNAEPRSITQKPAMAPYFMHIQDYNFLDRAYLPENAARMLDLDDYAYIDYDGPDGRVNLYIGYYLTADKAYAAHSPLVCYPSQGWKIIQKAQKHILRIGSNSVQYEEIITSFGNKRELVLYWYQADRFTATNVYMNKIHIGYNKITNNNQQFAFVRVSTPINTTYKGAKKSAVDFICAIYPSLINYIRTQ